MTGAGTAANCRRRASVLMAALTCICGRDVVLTIAIGYKYPRAKWEPMAMDPHYVHGGGGYRIKTCGNPQCEPDAFLACREEIIDSLAIRPQLPALSAEQLAGIEPEALPW